MCRIDEWKDPSEEALAGGRGMWVSLWRFTFTLRNPLFCCRKTNYIRGKTALQNLSFRTCRWPLDSSKRMYFCTFLLGFTATKQRFNNTWILWIYANLVIFILQKVLHASSSKSLVKDGFTIGMVNFPFSYILSYPNWIFLVGLFQFHIFYY